MKRDFTLQRLYQRLNYETPPALYPLAGILAGRLGVIGLGSARAFDTVFANARFDCRKQTKRGHIFLHNHSGATAVNWHYHAARRVHGGYLCPEPSDK